jgi:hypothetical protein
MLLDPLGVGALDDNRLDCRLQELAIRDVRPIDHDALRAAVSLDEEAPLGAVLGSVRRVRADAGAPIGAVTSGGPSSRRRTTWAVCSTDSRIGAGR